MIRNVIFFSALVLGLLQVSCSQGLQAMQQPPPATADGSYLVACTGVLEGSHVMNMISGVAVPTDIEVIERNERFNKITTLCIRYENISEKTMSRIRNELFKCHGIWAVNISKQ